MGRHLGLNDANQVAIAEAGGIGRWWGSRAGEAAATGGGAVEPGRQRRQQGGDRGGGRHRAAGRAGARRQRGRQGARGGGAEQPGRQRRQPGGDRGGGRHRAADRAGAQPAVLAQQRRQPGGDGGAGCSAPMGALADADALKVDANAAAIAAAGGVAPLEQLARDGDAKTWACRTRSPRSAQLRRRNRRREETAAARSERWEGGARGGGRRQAHARAARRHSCPITYDRDDRPRHRGRRHHVRARGRVPARRNRSPRHRRQLPHTIVVPNQALKGIIRDWEEQAHSTMAGPCRLCRRRGAPLLQRRKRRKTAK